VPASPTPPSPQITKHHPSSVDLELVKRLVASTRATNMVAFLTKEFDAIGKGLAGGRGGGGAWAGR
jgi:DNA topoisomerase-6 subunit B